MNKLLSAIAIAAIGSMFSWTNAAQAGSLIDFETLPNGALPTDNYQLGLDEAYLINGIKVTFGFDANSDGVTDTPVVLEKMGDDSGSGFIGYDVDTPDPEFADQLGQFFIRQFNTYQHFGTLIINYSSPVTGASGEIWDIDGSDWYQISAFDSDRNLLDTIVSPLGGLHAQPWTFDFSDLVDISQIEISYIGNESLIGLAFNNFGVDQTETEPVPEPLAILGIMLGTSLGMVTLKKKTWN